MINKTKSYISLIIIFSFLFYIINLPIYSATNSVIKHIKKGILYYDDAYFEEAVVSLEKALRYKLTKENEIITHLYLGLSKIALNKIDETKKHFIIIIKLDPTFSLDKNNFPPDVIKIVNDIKANYPVVFDFKALPKEFYPYRGDRPFIKFKLSASDTININISTSSFSLQNDSKYFKSIKKQTYYWDWSDKLLNAQSINISLKPKKNLEYSYSKKLVLNIKIPEKLVYYNGKFNITGRDFLPEAKWRKKPSRGLMVILWAAIGVAAGYGTLKVISNENSKSSTKIAGGFFLGSATYQAFKLAFSKKARSEEGYGYLDEEERVRLKSNARKNRQLKEDINQLKDQIKVGQKLIKSDD